MGSKTFKNFLDVSVVIVNYNAPDLLDKCLFSIIRLTTGLVFEIIVVDNNSTEGDVEQIISKYHDVIIIKNEKNIGFAAANNIGFKNAKGKYILILNNDTVFHENTIKILFDYSEKLNHEVFIGCKLLNADGSNQISVVEFDTISTSFGENFFLYKLFPKTKFFNRFYLNYKQIDKPTEVDVVKGAFIFCSAFAIKKLNGFDTRFFFFGEETDLCYRFKKNGGRVFYYPGTSIYHVGGATTDKNLWFKFKNQSIAKIKIYQKHYSGLESFALKAFHFVGIILRVPLYFLAGVLTFNKSLLIKSYFYCRTLFIYPPNKFKYDD
jgi:hypothetical protein